MSSNVQVPLTMLPGYAELHESNSYYERYTDRCRCILLCIAILMQ